MLNDDRRRRLAVKGKYLSRNTLEEVATIVTPDTIMRWHGKLVAKKWDSADRRNSAGRLRQNCQGFLSSDKFVHHSRYAKELRFRRSYFALREAFKPTFFADSSDLVSKVGP